ncbi:unnamed protein product [Rotaria sp. Silwood2]|nr:unnamed protein product [Rotaria sp. Silwood2]CAF4377455.1 unnamed protein product [Rotaria sp. Silwood2]
MNKLKIVYRSLNKQLREYELELNEERQSKQQILLQRKKLEIDLQGSCQQIDETDKHIRNTSLLQVIIRYITLFCETRSKIALTCAFIYGKRRLEAYITQLEEELEEEQTNTEIICDKHKKLAIIVEQLMLDLAAEKVNNQKAETEKASVRVRNMKRREEEVTQMKQRLRKALREEDEIEENSA